MPNPIPELPYISIHYWIRSIDGEILRGSDINNIILAKDYSGERPNILLESVSGCYEVSIWKKFIELLANTSLGFRQ